MRPIIRKDGSVGSCYTCARPTDLIYQPSAVDYNQRLRVCPWCLIHVLDFERTGAPNVLRRAGEEVMIEMAMATSNDQEDTLAYAIANPRVGVDPGREAATSGPGSRQEPAKPEPAWWRLPSRMPLQNVILDGL